MKEMDLSHGERAMLLRSTGKISQKRNLSGFCDIADSRVLLLLISLSIMPPPVSACEKKNCEQGVN